MIYFCAVTNENSSPHLVYIRIDLVLRSIVEVLCIIDIILCSIDGVLRIIDV